MFRLHGDCSIRIGGLGFDEAEIADCVRRKGLLSVELDLTAGKCHCASCRAKLSTGDPLSIDEIRDLLVQAKKEGARRCILADNGHPDLSGVIDAACESRMRVELIVSPGRVDRNLAKNLSERDVAIILTDGISHFAIKALKDAGHRDKISVAISVSDSNIADIPMHWRSARAEGVEPYVQVITPASVNEQSSVVSPARAKKLFEELGRIDCEEFGRTWDIPPSLIGRSCKRHLFACHVTPCGNIFACVGVTIPLGNIRSKTLREILELSEVLENLRDFESKVKEPCRTCSQTTNCYGCRGAAYQLTGDYLTGDEMCWKVNGTPVESLPVSVAGLVPHGKSMRLIDRIIRIEERQAITTFAVRPDCVLVDGSGRLDELAYIEMIAQSFAASHGFHLSVEERKRHRGLLLGVKELVVSGEARVGDVLTIDLRKVTRFGAFGVVEGEIFRQDGTLVARGEVKIWRPSDEHSGDKHSGDQPAAAIAL
jgi:radical SAM protein with 4Fe4S-binding SPASM domain